MLSEKDLSASLQAFVDGSNYRTQDVLGVHREKRAEGEGFAFRVWAPHAQQVWLVGDFNQWDEHSLPMQKDQYGVWSIFTDQAQAGQLYKFNIKQSTGHEIMKIDPFAVCFEQRPGVAARIIDFPNRKWKDGLWRGRQKREHHFNRPLNIYEVHAGSWRFHEDGTPYDFSDLTRELIPYLKKMHYSHVEFMPLMEHPLPASWGYQIIGFYALCSSYGTPEQFQEFVESCHQANIGVIVDWVPGHFNINDDALAYYDGTATFEYEDADRAKNIGWGALNFDLGKPQVQSFLISSALFWLNAYHVDGIRADAISSIIYLDYDFGPWKPNKYGDTRNLEGYDFLHKATKAIKLEHPESLWIAEESSAGVQVSGRIEDGALGFDYKWNMGWMNDTLDFYSEDPIYRSFDFHKLTFSFMYRLAENFILPLSHDEVVHGKRSLMNKMWGDRYKQFAQLRNLYVWQMTHPGKKLLFMGGEFGQYLEWKYDAPLEWVDLKDPLNQSMQHFTAVLNGLYHDNPSLWELDTKDSGLEIIDADNKDQTVLSYIRHGKRKRDFLIVILNYTPVERRGFKIGVPYAGTYHEILNTEMKEFGGTWTRNNPACHTKSDSFKEYEYTIETTVPALGALILKPGKDVKIARRKPQPRPRKQVKPTNKQQQQAGSK